MKARIITKCIHGKKTIGNCRECKKIYYRRWKKDTSRYLWTAAKIRAKNRNVQFSIAPTDIQIPQICPVLGIPLDSRDREHTPSLDCIIPELGYIPNNICVVSGRANRLKSDATEDELLSIHTYVKLRGRVARFGIPDSW